MAIIPWRFLDSTGLSAQENMELDKSLYENFQEEPIFRLYTWKPNSFTIGRFQKLEEIKNSENFGDNWAKRVTGGGLLLHGFDLSYTIIIPTKLLNKKSVKESYEYLCSFLLNFYQKLGLHVQYAKDLHVNLEKSFFCQEGFEAYDMICNGKKLGGNAQKRGKNLILQHGSIPLRNDQRKFTGTSLEEFDVNLNEKKAKKLLKESFIETFNAILNEEEI
ncbi:lipoate--protein ligase family protein [Sulfurospirillum arcachonense]|uniref:lipoate--protein ligase family protein n=1 Tax=Sulfurospirillum arcachonense TaxID=57666 RepID=UPI00046B0314|nr:lipoate--protein ligase family protein [Sulfurospirillum arcachonense]